MGARTMSEPSWTTVSSTSQDEGGADTFWASKTVWCCGSRKKRLPAPWLLLAETLKSFGCGRCSDTSSSEVDSGKWISRRHQNTTGLEMGEWRPHSFSGRSTASWVRIPKAGC